MPSKVHNEKTFCSLQEFQHIKLYFPFGTPIQLAAEK